MRIWQENAVQGVNPTGVKYMIGSAGVLEGLFRPRRLSSKLNLTSVEGQCACRVLESSIRQATFLSPRLPKSRR
jgi:hypothetical protein